MQRFTETYALIDADGNYHFKGYRPRPAVRNGYVVARGYSTVAGAYAAAKRAGIEDIVTVTPLDSLGKRY